MIRFAKLPFKPDIQAIQQETRLMLMKAWSPHFNKSHYQGDWEVLSLRSLGGKADSIFPESTSQQFGYSDTPLLAEFPGVQKLIQQFKCPLMTVRLLNLKAGSIIKKHKDIGLCFEQGEARLHFPIFTNSSVRFMVDEQIVDMHEGECWYINANRLHEVANYGTADRVHLVIDCQVNEWLQGCFDQSEKTLVEEKQNREEMLRIIIELRLQNTLASNQIADQLQKELC